MELDRQQRRDFIALLCRVAWADGMVVVAERQRLSEILLRVGEGVVSDQELQTWLDKGPPRVNASLPSEAKQAFVAEAMRVATADHDVSPAEVRSLHEIINYYFTRLENLDDLEVG